MLDDATSYPTSHNLSPIHTSATQTAMCPLFPTSPPRNRQHNLHHSPLATCHRWTRDSNSQTATCPKPLSNPNPPRVSFTHNQPEYATCLPFLNQSDDATCPCHFRSPTRNPSRVTSPTNQHSTRFTSPIVPRVPLIQIYHICPRTI